MRGGAVLRAVAHRVVHVLEILEVSAFRAEQDRYAPRIGRPAVDAPVGIVRRHGAVRLRLDAPPLELEIVRRRAERRRVGDRQLFGKLVHRVGDHGEPAGVQLGHDLDNVHRHGRALVDHRRVRAVVLDERDVPRAFAGRDERVVVDWTVRRHDVDDLAGRWRRDLLARCLVGLHLCDGKRVDGSGPHRPGGFRPLADAAQRSALLRRQHVELQVAPAGALLHELALEHHLLVRGINVEAVGDRRRQAGEVVLAALELRRPGRPEREAVFVRERAFHLERPLLGDRRVDEVDDALS